MLVDYDLNFYFDEITPKIINKINITGNAITKDKTHDLNFQLSPVTIIININLKKI